MHFHISDIEHHFMCLLAICISSLEKCLFSHCPFFDWVGILDAISKMNDLCSFPRQTISISDWGIDLDAPITNAEEAEAEWFYEDLQDLLEVAHTKKMSFSS